VRLKILDSADLLDDAVALLNMPVRVGKGFPADGGNGRSWVRPASR